ncbi:nicotinate phosphoribosyltransferase, partial [Streptomyces roseolus]
RARATLDAAGLADVRIIASGGLDEYGVDRLVRQGAPIDAYAVGTKVGTASDAPYLDAAYKLVEYDGRPVMKLSAAKATSPGPKQVFRGPGLRDVVGLANEEPPGGTEPLLRTVMRGGLRTGPPDTLAAARARFEADLAEVPESARRLDGPVPPVPSASTRLSALTAVVRHRLAARTGAGP